MNLNPDDLKLSKWLNIQHIDWDNIYKTYKITTIVCGQLLYHAIKDKKISMVEQILKNGYNVKDNNILNYLIIRQVFFSLSIEITKLIIKYKGNLNIKYKSYNIPFMELMFRKDIKYKEIEYIKFLLTLKELDISKQNFGFVNSIYLDRYFPDVSKLIIEERKRRQDIYTQDITYDIIEDITNDKDIGDVRDIEYVYSV